MLRYSEAKQTDISELGAEKGFFAGPCEENKRREPQNTPDYSKGFSRAFSKASRGQSEAACCELIGVRILGSCSGPGGSAQDAPMNLQ